MIKEAEDYILSIPKFATKTSLENTRYMLDKLGISDKDMKIIHVAGTNGKGSVCAYMSNTLVHSGKKTGLFTSPHLVKINERIRIDNKPISDEKFVQAYETVKKTALEMEEEEGWQHPSFFEFLFGMAMWFFAQEGVDYIVLETGLGGRLDSTNVITRPLMTVITSVSLDHMHILGDTVEQIAGEKAGIIKKNVPLVFYGEDAEVCHVIENKAEEMQAPFEKVDLSCISDIVKKDKFIDFSLNNRYYCNKRFSVHSEALYQVRNAALAAVALAGLKEQAITPETIFEGIQTTVWEGRMEEIRPDVYVDGAHNEDGIRVFLETAKAMKDCPQVLMFSAVADKDYDTMIREICESKAFDRYVVCTVENKTRALPASIFEEEFRKYTDAPVYMEETGEAALARALKLKQEQERLFIAGSLYLVGEIKRLMK